MKRRVRVSVDVDFPGDVSVQDAVARVSNCLQNWTWVMPENRDGTKPAILVRSAGAFDFDDRGLIPSWYA